MSLASGQIGAATNYSAAQAGQTRPTSRWSFSTPAGFVNLELSASLIGEPPVGGCPRRICVQLAAAEDAEKPDVAQVRTRRVVGSGTRPVPQSGERGLSPSLINRSI